MKTGLCTVWPCDDGGPSQYCLVTRPLPRARLQHDPGKNWGQLHLSRLSHSQYSTYRVNWPWIEERLSQPILFPFVFQFLGVFYNIYNIYISTRCRYLYISPQWNVSAITRGSQGWLQLAGVIRCPTARSASHAASAAWSLWSALEWLNYSSKYFFGGGFVSTQKIIVQIPQPLPVQLTKK